MSAARCGSLSYTVTVKFPSVSTEISTLLINSFAVFSIGYDVMSYTFTRSNFPITALITVPLFKIAMYRSVSLDPVSDVNARAGEKLFTRDETPSKLPKRSAFSAGNTDAVDLYHF